MRRMLIVATVIATIETGCAPESPVRRPASPAPYRIRDIPSERRERPPERFASRPPSFDPAWLPIGGKISPRWTTIVVHHSATSGGSARSFDRYHRDKGWDELGYHFVIGNGTDTPDGLVEVGSRWNKQKHGAHCKTPDNYYNEHGIGICLVGDFTKTRPTLRQLAALERLTAFLSERCGISPDRVVSHQAVNRKTLCPGPYFPMSSLRRAVASANGAHY